MKISKKSTGTIAIILIITIIATVSRGNLKGFIERLTAVSAAVTCIQAIPEYLKSSKTTDLDNSNSLESVHSSEESIVSSAEESSASEPITFSMPQNAGTVETTLLSLTAANTNTNGVHISNKTDLEPDYKALMEKGLPFKITDTSDVQVLIVHTHATEAYSEGDFGYYDKDNESARTQDNSKNTVRVGAVLAKLLNDGGITTINDETQHDNPAYSGSYARSEQTILNYLKKYPSIKVVIDLHRDSISGSGDIKIKPTCEINGKKAAQIMLLAGAETGDITGFPNWKENLQFNLLLQKQLESDYPDLCRPLSFKECIYNFDLLNGSILIEVGSEVNTLAEAEYSAQLFGRTLLKVLRK